MKNQCAISAIDICILYLLMFFGIKCTDCVMHGCLDSSQENVLLSGTVDSEIRNASEYTAYQRDSWWVQIEKNRKLSKFSFSYLK